MPIRTEIPTTYLQFCSDNKARHIVVPLED